jgi:hypothetical protein
LLERDIRFVKEEGKGWFLLSFFVVVYNCWKGRLSLLEEEKVIYGEKM